MTEMSLLLRASQLRPVIMRRMMQKHSSPQANVSDAQRMANALPIGIIQLGIIQLLPRMDLNSSLSLDLSGRRQRKSRTLYHQKVACEARKLFLWLSEWMDRLARGLWSILATLFVTGDIRTHLRLSCLRLVSHLSHHTFRSLDQSGRHETCCVLI